MGWKSPGRSRNSALKVCFRFETAITLLTSISDEILTVLYRMRILWRRSSAKSCGAVGGGTCMSGSSPRFTRSSSFGILWLGGTNSKCFISLSAKLAPLPHLFFAHKAVLWAKVSLGCRGDYLVNLSCRFWENKNVMGLFPSKILRSCYFCIRSWDNMWIKTSTRTLGRK